MSDQDFIRTILSHINFDLLLHEYPDLTKSAVEKRLLGYLSPSLKEKKESFNMWSDGASRNNPGDAGIGVVIKDSEEDNHIEFGAYLGKKTNNEAEYHALIMGIREVLLFNPLALSLYMDSELVVKQIQGVYKVRDQNLAKLHGEAKALLAEIPQWKICHIPRTENKVADMLANRAIDGKETEKKYWIRKLKESREMRQLPQSYNSGRIQ